MCANRPVLFTKLISMSGKPWVCGPGGAGKGGYSTQLCRAAGPVAWDHCEPHRASAGVAINSRQLSRSQTEEGGTRGESERGGRVIENTCFTVVIKG